MITLYGINNCDAIRKTRKWLEQWLLGFSEDNTVIHICTYSQ
jgi:arsenate reductase-like glutaredoxin family protein|tara:strand:- start:755 stop:880 length:126 start_codon:yes stop_codon:yes gene_type:complete